jgi:hypothetical protein
MSVARARWAGVAAVAVALLGGAGCGTRLVPVRGKVTFPDGAPLTEGTVVFESTGGDPPVTARGDVKAGGEYVLGTFRPGDGAPPGRYRVLVAPRSDPNAVDRPSRPPPFDPRFADFKTSGLEVEVTPDRSDYPIEVTPATKARR